MVLGPKHVRLTGDVWMIVKAIVCNHNFDWEKLWKQKLRRL